MTAPYSHEEFERSWRAARHRNDFAALTNLALEHYDDDTTPQWLRDEISDVCGLIAEDLSENLNRRDDSDLGVFIIQLSSFLGPGGCMFTLLGLAYQCVQPGEQEGAVNPKIPDLLDSQLTMFDILPRTDWPGYALAWRELAIRRVEILVRLDLGRQVNAMRERYLESVRMADLIRVYEPAAPHLDHIRAKLPFLSDAHQRLCRYVPLLENDDEKKILLEDLGVLEDLISAGHEVLNFPRR